MELRHLRYFVAVAEELNFSRAARRLHVSQPPLSRQIRDLEAELGTPLFERSQNPVRLTPAGDYVYAQAKRLLEQTEELVKQARRIARDRTRELRIGYIAHVHGRLVIETAAAFRSTHPEASVRVFDTSTAEQVAWLIEGKLDLGFVGFAEAPVEQGLQVEPIGTTHAIMALPRGHCLAKAKAQPLARFKNEPFVTIKEDAFPGARQYVQKFCAAAGFQPRIVHEAVQPIDVLNLVAMGSGVALVPERIRISSHPGVVFRELRAPVPRIESFVAWRAGSSSALMADFIEAAKKVYARVAGTGTPLRNKEA